MYYQKLAYTLTKHPFPTPIYGLIVLRSDETIEPEARCHFAPEHSTLYITRIKSANQVTATHLQEMEGYLKEAVELFPENMLFDGLGFACTSAATLIGVDRVTEIIKTHIKVSHCTNPMTALIAYLKAHQLAHIAIITPYLPDISLKLCNFLKNNGFEITNYASFEESYEANVVRIDDESILKAVLELGRDKNCDAVFISCTNLRTRQILTQAEAILQKPVISSNKALFWHLQHFK